mmetsp:Transcript_564/g.845  ORF Transcript_564/g.845 Transcript_564/m.845 type:complete len:218 (+) Transcript_564:7582-8235(+)
MALRALTVLYHAPRVSLPLSVQAASVLMFCITERVLRAVLQATMQRKASASSVAPHAQPAKIIQILAQGVLLQSCSLKTLASTHVPSLHTLVQECANPAVLTATFAHHIQSAPSVLLLSSSVAMLVSVLAHLGPTRLAPCVHRVVRTVSHAKGQVHALPALIQLSSWKVSASKHAQAATMSVIQLVYNATPAAKLVTLLQRNAQVAQGSTLFINSPA